MDCPLSGSILKCHSVSPWNPLDLEAFAAVKLTG